jgi:hypothetical protein
MRISESIFFTARWSIAEIPPLRGFARDAEFAEEKFIFFSDERAEKKMIYALVLRKSHSRAHKSIYFHKIVTLL